MRHNFCSQVSRVFPSLSRLSAEQSRNPCLGHCRLCSRRSSCCRCNLPRLQVLSSHVHNKIFLQPSSPGERRTTNLYPPTKEREIKMRVRACTRCDVQSKKYLPQILDHRDTRWAFPQSNHQSVQHLHINSNYPVSTSWP